MPERSYTEELKHNSEIVQNLIDSLEDYKVKSTRKIDSLCEKIDSISIKLEKVEKDSDTLIEGDGRHGVEPVRSIATKAMDISKTSLQETRALKKKILTYAAGFTGGVIVLSSAISFLISILS